WEGMGRSGPPWDMLIPASRSRNHEETGTDPLPRADRACDGTERADSRIATLRESAGGGRIAGVRAHEHEPGRPRPGAEQGKGADHGRQLRQIHGTASLRR